MCICGSLSAARPRARLRSPQLSCCRIAATTRSCKLYMPRTIGWLGKRMAIWSKIQYRIIKRKRERPTDTNYQHNSPGLIALGYESLVSLESVLLGF
jgi:hypothetical protein